MEQTETVLLSLILAQPGIEAQRIPADLGLNSVRISLRRNEASRPNDAGCSYGGINLTK